MAPRALPCPPLQARAASAKTSQQIQEMMSGLNTSNAVVAFDKMEQKRPGGGRAPRAGAPGGGRRRAAPPPRPAGRPRPAPREGGAMRGS